MRGLWYFGLAAGRFEEEVGHYDWIQRNYGKVSSIDWSSNKPFVGTERGVIACLNKDGTPEWRVTQSSQTIEKVLIKGSIIVSVAADGSVFGRNVNGELIWQRPGLSSGRVTLAEVEDDIVFSTTKVAERRSPLGEIRWSVAAENEEIVGATSNVVVVEKNGKVKAFPAGQRDKDWNLDCTGPLTILGNYALGFGTSEVLVCSLEKQAKPTRLDLSKWTPGTWRFIGGNNVDVVGLTNGAHTVIARLTAGNLKVLSVLNGQAAIGPVEGRNAASKLVSIAQTSGKETTIHIYNPQSGEMSLIATVPFEQKSNHGGADLVVVREAKNSGDVRMLVTFGDHSWASISNTGVVWAKEEALAMIDQALFGSAPKINEEETDLLDLTPYGIAWRMEGSMATFFNGVIHVITTLLKRNKSPHDSYLDIYCSTQFILCLSKRAGKLIAVEAVTGDIAWSRYLGDISDGLMLLEKQQLVLMTETNGKRILTWLNPISGQVLHQEEAKKYGSKMAIRALRVGDGPLPVIDVDVSNENAHVYPSNNTVPSRKHFHFDVRRETSEIQGYVVGSKLDPLWNLAFSHVNEKVLTVATPVHQDEDATPVYVKGDASVIYKYLNPNIAAILTESLDINEPSLNIYVINSVTGQILHQSRIKNAVAPVKVLACENWVVVHYWNMQQTRFELYVVELFDPKIDDGPWAIVAGGMNHTTRSVYDLEAPIPLEQTYIFPSGVKAMGVSTTAHGVTPRSILLVLDTDQILSIPKTILNPRRPDAAARVKPSSSIKDEIEATRDANAKKIAKQFEATKDEMIVPYLPYIQIKQLDIISYHQLVNVDDLLTHASDMESTSLVFAYGVDLFFTIVQTANAFDQLSPIFNYFVLYTSVGFVIAITVVSHKVAVRKAVTERWK